MQVVYIDSLFLLNTIMDYLLLLASARIAGEPLHQGRMALAALLGGGYAAAAVLPGMELLSGATCKIAAAVLMVLVGLGGSRRLLRQLVIFFALAFAIGGGVLAVALLGGRGLHPANGMLFSGPDVKLVLLTGALCYAVWTLFLKGLGRRNTVSGGCVPVEVYSWDRKIAFTALRDTGNTLTDPVSGQGMIVLDWQTVLPLLEEELRLRPQEIGDPVSAVSRLNRGRWNGRWGLIPYRAVGVSSGMLITLRPDRVRIAGREQGRMQLALSPTPVSPNGGWQGLVAAVE